mgnify:CR=1 FL=1
MLDTKLCIVGTQTWRPILATELYSEYLVLRTKVGYRTLYSEYPVLRTDVGYRTLYSEYPVLRTNVGYRTLYSEYPVLMTDVGYRPLYNKYPAPSHQILRCMIGSLYKHCSNADLPAKLCFF